MVGKPLNRTEYLNLTEMLKGCINRMCVTHDQIELSMLYESANEYLHRLYFASEHRIHQSRDKKEE